MDPLCARCDEVEGIGVSALRHSSSEEGETPRGIGGSGSGQDVGERAELATALGLTLHTNTLCFDLF